MNRIDLQKLAKIRSREARILLDAGYYSGSYYLAGYSVECALKACIAKQVQRHDFPDKKRVQDSYTHSLPELLRIAELQAQMKADGLAAPTLGTSWVTVQRWTEASRYSVMTQIDAQDMIRAVAGAGGILPWIVRRW
jgi:HEPN domain-containing protein